MKKTVSLIAVILASLVATTAFAQEAKGKKDPIAELVASKEASAPAEEKSSKYVTEGAYKKQYYSCDGKNQGKVLVMLHGKVFCVGRKAPAHPDEQVFVSDNSAQKSVAMNR